MAVLNDFGPAAYDRIVAQINQMASNLGIQPEIITQYVNETAHFPQTLQELVNWGNTPDPVYGFRRRQPNGVWTPLYPGPTPGTGGPNDPGFRHVINNAVDKLERFLNVDPGGNVWGGSWDPSYNSAHPELAGQTGFASALGGVAATGPRTSQALGGDGTMYAAQANPYAPGTTEHDVWETGNPSGSPYDPNTPPSTGGGVPPASSGGSSGGGGGGGNVGMNPTAIDAMISAANIAYQNKRIELDRYLGDKLDEREKHRIALEAARDAANQTGYVPGSGMAGKGQAVMDALAGLRTNPQYQQADGDTKRRMEAATVSQATGMDLASAAQGIDRLRALTATTGQMSTPQLVEQVFGQTPGGAGTPTLDREKEQNQTAMDALRLLSTLRGPENAFVYANTLANVPESIRRNIAAATARLPMTARNPAQAGLMGDVGWTGQAAAPGTAATGGVPGVTGTGPGGATSFTPSGDAGTMYRTQAPAAAGSGAFRPPPTGLERVAAGQQGGNVAQAPAYGPRTVPVGTAPSPAVAAGMTAPNQWSPTDYLRTDPYARKLQLAAYENAGEDPESVQWRYQQSLPRAVGPRTGQRRAA